MTFIRDFLIAVFLLFAAAAAVFRTVDPRGDFGTGVFPLVVRESRAEKMRLLRDFPHVRDLQGLILGSSRSMELAPERLRARSGRRFFNFGVDSARAEDYLAIWRWVRAQNVHPALLIVGLDIEALHDDDVPENGLLANRELQRALTGRDDPWVRFRTYKRAFTPTYITDALESLRRWAGPPHPPRYFYEADGLLRNTDIEAQRAAGTFDFTQRIPGCFAIYVARFQNMAALSPQRKRDLETLIAEQHAAGGRTIVWLTPLHPATVAHLEGRTQYRRLLTQTRQYLDELRETTPVATFDFSEPRLYGGTTTDWDDCAHTSPIESARIASALSAETGGRH